MSEPVTAAAAAPRDPAVERAHAWSFFQLVRALVGRSPGAPSPGGPGPAGAENIRFRPDVTLGFPAGDVQSVERLAPAEDGTPERWRVTVNFMGLYGPSSPMPNHFTEDMMDAGGEEDAGRDFVDLFNHRMISFVYRAWEKYRYPLCFQPGGGDAFTQRVLCLLGLGTRGMEEGTGLALVPLMRTAGLLADRHRSAVGLEQFLVVHLGLRHVRVEPCIEHRVRIPYGQLMRLGRPSAALGDSAVLGERLVDRAGSFLLVIGPLDLITFRRFLPGGDSIGRLVALTRLYVRDPLGFRVALRLVAPEVPALRLSPDARLGLGHLSWLAPPGREEGRAAISIRAYDPLHRRRERPSPPAGAPAPPPPGLQIQVRPAAPGGRTAPRVTTIRRN